MKLATRREHTGNRQLDAMQRETARIAERANECPFLVGVMRSVRLSAGVPKTIDHGLGVPATFLLARPNYSGSGAAAGVVEAPSQGGLDRKKQLAVVASADCLVDLWLYPVASEARPR